MTTENENNPRKTIIEHIHECSAAVRAAAAAQTRYAMAAGIEGDRGDIRDCEEAMFAANKKADSLLDQQLPEYDDLNPRAARILTSAYDSARSYMAAATHHSALASLLTVMAVLDVLDEAGDYYVRPIPGEAVEDDSEPMVKEEDPPADNAGGVVGAANNTPAPGFEDPTSGADFGGADGGGAG